MSTRGSGTPSTSARTTPGPWAPWASRFYDWMGFMELPHPEEGLRRRHPARPGRPTPGSLGGSRRGKNNGDVAGISKFGHRRALRINLLGAGLAARRFFGDYAIAEVGLGPGDLPGLLLHGALWRMGAAPAAPAAHHGPVALAHLAGPLGGARELGARGPFRRRLLLLPALAVHLSRHRFQRGQDAELRPDRVLHARHEASCARPVAAPVPRELLLQLPALRSGAARPAPRRRPGSQLPPGLLHAGRVHDAPHGQLHVQALRMAGRPLGGDAFTHPRRERGGRARPRARQGALFDRHRAVPRRGDRAQRTVPDRPSCLGMDDHAGRHSPGPADGAAPATS